jgi:membrane associated rhomboid family serine protease
MIPLRAENPRRTFALVNVLLILVNIAVFAYQVSLPPRAADRLVLEMGVVPARTEHFLSSPSIGIAGAEAAFVPLLTSMFLHGGLLHILGNMLFLWVFGASVEDHLGHIPYLLFYLICGLGAGVTHIIANWGSTISSIGASGAISGVMGAYIVLFPRSRILTLVPIIIFFFTVRLPAVLILGYWFLIQFLSGFASLGEIDQTGVAWWAHIGGFLLGALLAFGM